MDANAFETAQIPKEVINNKPAFSTEEERPLNGLVPSLRGLYPLAAMMNHACTPNTRHGYDEEQKMTVRAASFIPAGTEITSTYTSLLWGTSARRHHLKITKHFLCYCPRCRDPQVKYHHYVYIRNEEVQKSVTHPFLSTPERLNILSINFFH
jgi:hypothetical protein